MSQEASSPVLRTVILPEFTPEQIAYLDERMAAARFRPKDDQQRIGGVQTLPRGRLTRI
jgi:hypothetical protein